MDKKVLTRAYETALKIRSVEQIISDNYHKGFMRCPTHLSIGQEMVASILSCFNNPKDLAVSTHRSHAHYLGKGGELKKLFDELHGLKSGCSGGKGGSMHLIDKNAGFVGSTAIVGNTIPIGVGLAEAQKLSNESFITYIFLGDGATEEGVFYESLNYASVRKLPCIFIIENNEYSVYTPLKDRQGVLSIGKKCEAFNLKYYKVENHDFSYLHKKWIQVLESCRSGDGPSVIEVFTHRYLEHCGPNQDDNLCYRPESFLNYWQENDIINSYENNLIKYEISSSDIKKMKISILENCKRIFELSEEEHIKLRNLE